MKSNRSGKSSAPLKRSKWLGVALVLALLSLTFVALQMRAGVGLFRKAQAQGIAPTALDVLGSRYLTGTANSLAEFLTEAAPASTPTPTPTPCPGPALCGISCRLDAFGTPIYCSNGQCSCAPGYDTETRPDGSLVCQPHQPGFMGFGARGDTTDVDCPGGCTSTPWGSALGPWKDFDIVAVHGTSPGGEPFMPVWGAQATNCGLHGNGDTADGNPIRSWAGCVADALPFCRNIQELDEGYFNTCHGNGCGENDTPQCVSDFTSAWPFLDTTTECNLFALGYGDPARIDFPNNVIVYRAPIVWENHSTPDPAIPGGDDDYTWNMHSPGSELYDTLHSDARVHVEHNSGESIDRFTSEEVHENPFGTASLWWTQLRKEIDNNDNDAVQCWLRHFVNPSLDCSDPRGHDPMAVVVGVPSLDCGDHPDAANDSEIHPAYALAIRIQEGPSQPEQWAFFYRRQGDNGFCGNTNYSRCGTTYQLPLGVPIVHAGVLTSADVQVDFHAWDKEGDPPSDVTVVSNFDPVNGTVLTITLPGGNEGVVGLVTVTPHMDTTPPTITCPGNMTTPVDLGKCTAAVTFTPTVSDNCSVSAVCSTPSGAAFPLGTTMDTCTATDQAGLTASCSFNVTVTAGNKCPQAQGYWKKHTDLWPVNSLTLGNVTYTKAQLISILNNSTTGDASVVLAKSEIAALLNLANSSNPVPICGTIADADSALDGCTVPCKIGPKTVTGQRMISDANTLDSYNNGKLTTGCAP